MKIRVLIVDDEAWARKRIATLLKSERDIEIAGQCASGMEAIAQIESLLPDLVFLDVQMPDFNGFEVLDGTSPERMPLIIFATAYDKYALQAFDAHAFDYLLKPFDEERFGEALNRAREELQRPRADDRAHVRSLLDSLRKNSGYLERLAIKSGGRIIFIKASEIDWIEAAGNYVTLHVGRNTHTVRATLNAFVPKLDSGQFVRIHRSTVVNLDRIQEVRPWFHGEQVLKLKDGTELTVGRVFRHGLTTFLENPVD
jgi:two-component system, LytTR family, response regulator